MKNLLYVAGFLTLFFLGACKDEKLPYYGDAAHRIADFRFRNQDSVWISNDSFADKIYVADFFFTTCPTICPIMSKNLQRVATHFKGNPSIAILSHSIDPKHDSIPVLKKYAEKLGADTSLWHFVGGPAEQVYTLAEKSYFAAAAEEEEAPGGYIHSGSFALVDRDRRIRGIYDGTVDEQVSKLIDDMEILLKENSGQTKELKNKNNDHTK
ncbi:SCO family protein [Olivibacter jilunii]|uniref:SCO family protein n=1 Tax=Olivibacter jilunii TaxID=985016 RepID=UPI003F17F34F